MIYERKVVPTVHPPPIFGLESDQRVQAILPVELHHLPLDPTYLGIENHNGL